MLEVIPAADPDQDGRLSAEELAAVADQLGAYVNANYALTADSGGDPRRGRLLTGELVGLALDESSPGALASEPWIELTLDYRTDALITDLLLSVTVFMGYGSHHQDICELVWNDDEPQETVFTEGAEFRYYGPSSLPTLRSPLGWMRMGVEHILTGWDHLAFVLALIVATRNVRSLLWTVTAFTLAHSITLALAALDLVAVPARPVEMMIAFSIAWVGLANLLSQRGRSRWPEAFVFGLVHGLGFAGFLGEALWGEPRRLLPLVGFNVGVELGQLAVVLAVLLPLLLLRRLRASRPAADDPWLAPRWLRVPVSAAVVLAGAYWFVERAWL